MPEKNLMVQFLVVAGPSNQDNASEHGRQLGDQKSSKNCAF